jgi:PAS domain S-box-containing protein
MSEAPYRIIVEQTPEAVVFTDTEGAVRIWNRAAETLFGYTKEEAVAGGLDLIIPERLRAAHWKGFRDALASASPKYAGRVLTTRSMHKDGRTLYVALAFALLKDDGAFVGVLATARDCTESYLAARGARNASPQR